ncbi:MAG TPA: MFS transporter [Candidatus Saccharimonadales bacterium]|nr:MFS transporter [Candidatus Saccharimonadales bacterium]
MISDIAKIKIARCAAAAVFWFAIGVLFFEHNGLSTSQAYTLISLYYFGVVLFEFPTGVIGDHFSHKTALIAGHLITAAALILLGLGGGFLYIAVCLLIAAIGITLTSGSDTALTHALSKNFKKDQSQIKLYATAVIVAATALGPLLAAIDIGLPFIITGICNVVAALFIWSIHTPSPRSSEGNLFRTARKSFSEIRQRPLIFRFLILSASIMAFMVSLKWFYNPLLAEMNVPLAYWGVIMGLSLLVPLFGIAVYRYGQRTHIVAGFLLFALSIIPIGLVQIAAISILALYVTAVLSGYLDAAIDILLNNTIQTVQRAGILSLSNLLSRLGAGAYMPAAGFIFERTSFLVLMISTSIGLLLVCASSLLYVTRTKH